jgi:cytochrome c biogenesis protein CcmG, thiol:disulfide interchange protein DsbE
MRAGRRWAVGGRRPLPLLLPLLLLAACTRGDAGATRGAAETASADGGAFQPLAIGEAVPAYAAPVVGGGAGDSVRVATGDAAAAKGPLTLVNVWATWCTSCREEFADLERVHRDYRARGVRVVAVSVDESSDERVARFARTEGVTFTIAHDPEGRVQRLYQTVGVPETYLVSGDGRLLWRHGGALSEGAPEAREAIDRALEPGTR